MMTGEKQFTKSGNLKPPLHEVYLQWIVDAWNNLTPKMIKKILQNLWSWSFFRWI